LLMIIQMLTHSGGGAKRGDAGKHFGCTGVGFFDRLAVGCLRKQPTGVGKK
jgi:hypothetical protein